jgi:hypothetical protein
VSTEAGTVQLRASDGRIYSWLGRSRVLIPSRALISNGVDWAGLTHAYGGAEDVPVLIRSLMSANADERSAALEGLFGSICHQGTVYPASAPAVPFLARAAVAAPGGRAGIGFLLTAMARQYGEDWSDPATFSGAVRAQIASVLSQLAPLLTDPDPGVRGAVLRVMAVCPSRGWPWPAWSAAGPGCASGWRKACGAARPLFARLRRSRSCRWTGCRSRAAP